MSNIGVNHDVNSWNLDFLDFASTKQAYLNGIKRGVRLQPEFGPVAAIEFLWELDFIAVLRPEARLIQSIDTSVVDTRVLFQLTDVELAADMAIAVREKCAYVLDSARNCLIRKDLHGTDRVWPIEIPFLPSSRLILDPFRFPATLFIAPTVDGRVIRLSLKDNSANAAAFSIYDSELRSSPSYLKLPGAGADFCIDHQNDTLLMADPIMHRVVEVDISSGIVRRTYGGKLGCAQDGVHADQATFSAPAAVQIYRPEGSPLKDFLSKQSRKVVDDSRILPRTILVADSGNLRVRKLVELPETVRLPTYVKKRSLDTLIGTGSEPGDEIQEIATAPESDLRLCSILRPRELALSLRGDLLIRTESNNLLILLRPVSAIPQNIEYAKGFLYDAGRT